MTEKINNILFHPSTLIEYRNTHILKVLLYLFILSTFSLLVPIINMVQNPDLTLSDMPKVKTTTGFKFDASQLPDCYIQDNQYTCSDNAQEPVVIEQGNYFDLVSDINGTMKVSHMSFVLTKDALKLENSEFTLLSIAYKDLPSHWQSFDFRTIKADSSPNDAFYLFFISGFNQILHKLVPFTIGINVIWGFLMQIVQVLFFSLLFYLFFRRFNIKFKEIFKITVFAETFSIILGVIFNLLQFEYMTTFITTTLIFFYVYIAMGSTLRPKV